MINLLQETIDKLKRWGKTPQDVLWVGGKSNVDSYDNNTYCRTTWDEFAKKANQLYDDGFGGEEVNQDLIIVGKDWWLERHEYDGSEWWEYKTLPDINDYPVGNVEVFYE